MRGMEGWYAMWEGQSQSPLFFYTTHQPMRLSNTYFFFFLVPVEKKKEEYSLSVHIFTSLTIVPMFLLSQKKDNGHWTHLPLQFLFFWCCLPALLFPIIGTKGLHSSPYVLVFPVALLFFVATWEVHRNQAKPNIDLATISAGGCSQIFSLRLYYIRLSSIKYFHGVLGILRVAKNFACKFLCQSWGCRYSR